MIPARLARNVKWGTSWGLAFGAFYSIWVLVLFAFSGTAAFDRLRITLPKAIMFYMLGGLVVGAIVGVLRPLSTRLAGAVAVGMIATVPLALGFRLVTRGLAPWTGVDTAALITSTIVLGGLGGLIFGSDNPR